MPGRPFSGVFDPLAVAQYVTAIREDLRESGLELESCDDFDDFEKAVRSTVGKSAISEPFDGVFFDITPADGLWIIGRKDGKVLHLQALRRDSLTGISLATFWNRYLDRIYDGRPALDHCPGAFQITGNVVYHGELWVDKDHRSDGIAPLTCRLAHGLALIKWAPDYIYGLITDQLIRSGFHVREGFAHAQPRAIEWERVPSNIDAADWLVWNSLEDLLHNVKLATLPAQT